MTNGRLDVATATFCRGTCLFGNSGCFLVADDGEFPQASLPVPLFLLNLNCVSDTAQRCLDSVETFSNAVDFFCYQIQSVTRFVAVRHLC